MPQLPQYINKSALVAEIERRIAEISEACQGYIADKKMAAEYILLNELRNFIDTLEVKEVDLEKEAKNFVKTGEFVKNENPVLAIAKYFFELGLKAQKG